MHKPPKALWKLYFRIPTELKIHHFKKKTNEHEYYDDSVIKTETGWFSNHNTKDRAIYLWHSMGISPGLHYFMDSQNHFNYRSFVISWNEENRITQTPLWWHQMMNHQNYLSEHFWNATTEQEKICSQKPRQEQRCPLHCFLLNYWRGLCPITKFFFTDGNWTRSRNVICPGKYVCGISWHLLNQFWHSADKNPTINDV